MSRWLKKLRERLRKQKPSILLASVIVTVGILGSLTWYIWGNISTVPEEEQVQSEAAYTLAAQDLEVILQRNYFAGPMSEETIIRSVEEREQIKEEYKDWTLVSESPKQLVFQTTVDDLSPIVKENGYFGITEEGILTIYEGEPNEQKVIQTFFQLDIERLESGLPKEEFERLKKGIRFTTLAQFNSILSTYGEFAIYEN